MKKTDIPHAVGEELVSGFPDSILHVKTNLPEHFGETGFNAERKRELLQAVAVRVRDDDLQGYQVHWSH